MDDVPNRPAANIGISACAWSGCSIGYQSRRSPARRAGAARAATLALAERVLSRRWLAPHYRGSSMVHHGLVSPTSRNRFDPILLRLLAKADPDLPQEKINAAIRDASDAAGEHMANALREGKRSMLIDHASLRRGFEIRLRDIWGEALDALYALYVVAVEAAEDYFYRTRDEAVDDDDILWEALLRIQARACHVASEIQALLRTGHAEGAQARWRTLHELTVVASFLREHDQSVARRYLEHGAITRWWDAQQYQKHAARLQFVPFTDEEMGKLKADHDELIRRYGRDYGREWGWAADVVKGPLGFASIENAVELSHWRPFYRDANAAVHAGSRRLSQRLGVDDAAETWLTGMSNAGLDGPGRSTAISLMIVTVTTLLRRPSVDSLVLAVVAEKLCNEADEAFIAAAAELERRIGQEEKEEARRARRRQRERERRATAKANPSPDMRLRSLRGGDQGEQSGGDAGAS
jgi:hypothetical protein